MPLIRTEKRWLRKPHRTELPLGPEAIDWSHPRLADTGSLIGLWALRSLRYAGSSTFPNDAVLDSSPNRYHLDKTPKAEWVTSLAGAAMDFDPSTGGPGLWTTEDVIEIDGATSISAMALVMTRKTDWGDTADIHGGGSGQLAGTIIGKSGDKGDDNFAFGIENGAKLTAYVDNGADRTAEDPEDLVAGEWYWVGMVYDGASSTLSVYKNGALVAQNTSAGSGGLVDNTNATAIGCKRAASAGETLTNPVPFF